MYISCNYRQMCIYIENIHIWGFTFQFFWGGAQIENSIAKRTQPTRPKQRILSENQETMLIWGPSFQVTTKLLRITGSENTCNIVYL
jgi:hypothetical protein